MLASSIRQPFASAGIARVKALSIVISWVALASSSGAVPLKRPSFVAAHYGSARTLVTVKGKRRLNLSCVGNGKITVLFLSGLGGGTFDWRKVQPAIGKVTRACAYDRAGYGFSDPATEPSDVASAVTDLHALLHSKAITTPVILVGHSLGGLYATAYALRYRNDAAGMVLVEPAFSGQTGRIAKAVGLAAAERLQAASRKTLAAVDECVALATAGRLSLPNERASDCLDNPPDPDPDIHHERNREAKSPAYERALRSEYEMANITGEDGRTEDDRQSAWAGANLASMPLVVLTRGDSENLSGLSAAEIAQAELAWRTGHDLLAQLSTVGTNRIIPNSKHFIQLDQPGAVVGAVLKLVAGVSH